MLSSPMVKLAFEVHVRDQARACADGHAGADDAIGSDFGFWRDFGVWIDDRGADESPSMYRVRPVCGSGALVSASSRTDSE